MGVMGGQQQPQQTVPKELTALGGLHRTLMNLAFLVEGLTGVRNGTTVYVLRPLQNLARALFKVLRRLAAATTPEPGWRRRCLISLGGDAEEGGGTDEEGSLSLGEGGENDEEGAGVVSLSDLDRELEEAWGEATAATSTRSTEPAATQHRDRQSQRSSASPPSAVAALKKLPLLQHWVLSLCVYLLLHRAAAVVAERARGVARRGASATLKSLVDFLATGGGHRRQLNNGRADMFDALNR